MAITCNMCNERIEDGTDACVMVIVGKGVNITKTLCQDCVKRTNFLTSHKDKEDNVHD